jgi:regulation of enolase protein 1 (concanavalin A-like superfamily)
MSSQAGIEYCDGAARLSVVVTNIFSDWSTQPWPSTAARLRLHKINKGKS